MSGERFVVVGGGIVGLAVARELGRRRPAAKVTVVEKEAAVGGHQTSHNSGVVHAGLYYPPGSLKAELCRRGRHLLRNLCQREGLPYDECGKVVVACHAGELEALAAVEGRARANQVPGLRRLDADALGALEPHAAGLAALHSPHTAITDFGAIAKRLASDLDVRTGFEAASFAPAGGRVVVSDATGEGLSADMVVICAGLQSDAVARRAGDGPEPAIVPFRGEYWRLVPARTGWVRGLIYPVPDPRYPFLGVHFTRRVDGAVDVGPNAVLELGRQAYAWRPTHGRPVRRLVEGHWIVEAARRRAVWNMARTNWRAGVHELTGSLSKRVFVARAARLVPGLTPADVVPGPAGVRAQAVDADGTLVDDFRIHRVGTEGRIVAVRNAPSPAATSSLAIAEHVCDQLL